jgi:hypothetical protein
MVPAIRDPAAPMLRHRAKIDHEAPGMKLRAPPDREAVAFDEGERNDST